MSQFRDFIKAANNAPDFFGDNVNLLSAPLYSAVEILNVIESAADQYTEQLKNENRYTPDYISQSRIEKVKQDRAAYQAEVLGPLSDLFKKASEQFSRGLDTAFYPLTSSDKESDRIIGESQKGRADGVYHSNPAPAQITEIIKTAVQKNELDFASRLVERIRQDFYGLSETERQAKLPGHAEKIDNLTKMVIDSMPDDQQKAVQELKDSNEKFQTLQIDFRALQKMFNIGSNYYVTEEMARNFNLSDYASTKELGFFNSSAGRSRMFRAEAEAEL